MITIDPKEQLSVEAVTEASCAAMAALTERLMEKLRSNPTSLTLNEFAHLIREFDRQKFSRVPITGTMLKAFGELSELCDAPGDAGEFADIFTLTVSIAGRGGVTDIATPTAAKLLEMWGQEFVMQPNGTGNRVKT